MKIIFVADDETVVTSIDNEDIGDLSKPIAKAVFINEVIEAVNHTKKYEQANES